MDRQEGRGVEVAVSTDYRDLVIETMAADEVLLLERLASVEADRGVYRELAQQAIHALHDANRQRDRLREQHHRLLDQYRHLRAQIMSAAVAA